MYLNQYQVISYDGVHEIPHLLVGGVKNMGAVLMYVNTLHTLTIDIATKLGALVNHQAPL